MRLPLSINLKCISNGKWSVIHNNNDDDDDDDDDDNNNNNNNGERDPL